MPQMAPLLWLNLFLMFSSAFLVFIILNYFMKSPQKMQKLPHQLLPNKTIWKW
uniref:ATP synthase F0 subunit 8 n=1 Tax=Halocaridinides fowleri TaxID=2010950 RepID=A0A1Z2R7D2_9EUCA|nr:ATP synthase F0 subunit 8 [Halocaridinides fowleri]ASA39622.1 ATP synthase F0 subunit 8 [Halocaridinides fowleri]